MLAQSFGWREVGRVGAAWFDFFVWPHVHARLDPLVDLARVEANRRIRIAGRSYGYRLGKGRVIPTVFRVTHGAERRPATADALLNLRVRLECEPRDVRAAGASSVVLHAQTMTGPARTKNPFASKLFFPNFLARVVSCLGKLLICQRNELSRLWSWNYSDHRRRTNAYRGDKRYPSATTEGDAPGRKCLERGLSGPHHSAMWSGIDRLDAHTRNG